MAVAFSIHCGSVRDSFGSQYQLHSTSLFCFFAFTLSHREDSFVFIGSPFNGMSHLPGPESMEKKKREGVRVNR